MPSANSNSDLNPESVHEAWMHQGADLERDLFENWTIEVHPSTPVARPRSNVPSAEAVGRQPAAHDQPSAAETPGIPEVTPQRIPEREELLQRRREVEAELTEARRIFEDKRQAQQHEFAQQRDAEISRLRRERDDFENRVRQTQLEQTQIRQRRDDDWRQIREMQLAQVRTERAELEHVRGKWLEMLRREQAVLQYGVQLFGQHLSRVSDELREAQRGLETASAFASEPTAEAAISDPSPSSEASKPFEPAILSLDEIRERLNELKQPQRTAA